MATSERLTQTLNSSVGGALRRVGSLASRTGSRIVAAFRKAGTSVKQFCSHLLRGNKYTSMFASRFRRILFGALIFNSVSTAVRNLTSALGAALKQNAAFTSAMANLKGAAYQCAAPLASVLTPVLTAAANAASVAASYLAQLLSSFTGKTLSQTKAEAAAIGAVGTAAKNAGKNLASFDTINRLDKNSSTQTIKPNFSFEAKNPFLDQVKAAIESGDWQGTGKLFADKMNGILASWDARDFGKKAGEKLQNAISLLYGFISGFDWSTLGNKLADCFNGLLSGIDTAQLGSILAAKWAILIGVIGGFLENIDPKQFADSISRLVTGFLDTITEAIQNIDWAKVAQNLVDIICNLDYDSMAQSLGRFFGAVCLAAVEFFGTLISNIVSKIAEKFTEGFTNGKKEAEESGAPYGLAIIEGILNGILDAFASIGEWIWEHIFKPFKDGFCEAFGIHSPSKEAAEWGGYIIEGMLNGILDAFVAIGQWVQDHIFTPFKDAICAAFGINGGSSTQAQQWGTSTMQGLLDGVTGLLGNLSDTLSRIKQSFHDTFSYVSGDLSAIWQGIQDSARRFVNTLLSIVNGMIRAVVSGMNSMIRLLNSFSVPVPSFAQRALGTSRIGFSISELSAPQIPYLAQGAVIPPNREFLAVLGDQKSGTNIEAPLETIQAAVAEVQGDTVAALMAGFEALKAELQALREDVRSIEVGDDVIGRAADRYADRRAVMMGGRG